MILNYEAASRSVIAACMYWHPAMITAIMEFAHKHISREHATISGVHLFLPHEDIHLLTEQLQSEARYTVLDMSFADRMFNYGGFAFFVHACEPVKPFIQVP